jgi:nucleoside-diphosphate-sugar epimerase
MTDETFLVTGAMGCVGSWVLRDLVHQGVRAIALDVTAEPVRPALLLTPEELSCVTFTQADITALDQLLSLVEAHQVTHIIHLAALQVPGCRGNPSLGSRVNVVGTVHVLEAARRFQGQVRGLAYASSVAALGPAAMYAQRPLPDDAPLHPETLYGVFKQANEHSARLYWQDWGVGSVGLRPFIVFGVGRDQGMTSDIAKAILAAAAGRPYHIQFDGQVALQYAADVARMFVDAARAEVAGAAACNLRNDVIEVSDFIAMLQACCPEARVTCEAGHPLPFPADLDDSGLRRILPRIPHTPVATAIEGTLEQFQTLLRQGRIDLSQLGE